MTILSAPPTTSSGLYVNGPAAGSILWNFYQAKTLRVSYIGFRGSVLAPGADATFEWGSMNGTLVAKSVNSTSEMFDAPFRGNCLVPN
jgi:choice-of-anchor A domain-containing protein